MKFVVRFISFIGLTLGLCQWTHAQDLLQSLTATAALDLAAPIALDSASQSRLYLRAGELRISGPSDHLFEGILSLAAHEEDGETVFEVHEATLGTSRLVPGMRFRAGKYFLPVGRLNRTHAHDWPFTTAPKVHRELFTPGIETPLLSEGASDLGVEASYLLPTSHFLEWTMGLTNGWCFGHCHTQGSAPPYPLHYARLATFFDLNEEAGLSMALSYLGRKSSDGISTSLAGMEATYKLRRNRRLLWLMQSEAYLQTQYSDSSGRANYFGFYIFGQRSLAEQWALGLRIDGYTHLNLRFSSTGEHRKDFDYALAPSLSFLPSEFTTLRLSYSHEVDTTQGVSDTFDRQLQLQFIWILGSHPAHEF